MENTRKIKYTFVVFILALMAALQPLGIDLYLPAFQQIAAELGTNLGYVQISLSVFLAGFALGQLFWGPISDYSLSFQRLRSNQT